MTKTIGLTGSIATGKSTVSKWFAQQGIPVVDADQIAKEVVEPGQKAYQKIVSTFGEEILQDNQFIDRKKLGKIIFSNPTKRDQLNHIVHPIIIDRMTEEIARYRQLKEPVIILDIPLLFENELSYLVDKVVVVYTTPRQQLERLMQRDQLTEQEANERISAQMSIDVKVSLADHVINNSGSVNETQIQCIQFIDMIKTR